MKPSKEAQRKLRLGWEAVENVRRGHYPKGTSLDELQGQLKRGTPYLTVYCLMSATRVCIPTWRGVGPENEMAFSPSYDDYLKSYRVQVNPHQTTVTWHEKALEKKYNIMESSDDRADLMTVIISAWQRKEGKIREPMEKRSASKSKSKIQKARDEGAAHRILRSHSTRRLTHRVHKPYKPSPLGENGANIEKGDEESEGTLVSENG